MAYEVFQRTAVRVEDPTLSLVPDGRIALNAAATRLFREAGVKFVVILWDKANQKVALKAAPKGDKNAYAVSDASGRKAGSITAKSFLSHIGWRAPRRETLSASWNEKDKTLEITLPRKYVAPDK
jgi:hypothetical protein